MTENDSDINIVTVRKTNVESDIEEVILRCCVIKFEFKTRGSLIYAPRHFLMDFHINKYYTICVPWGW